MLNSKKRFGFNKIRRGGILISHTAVVPLCLDYVLTQGILPTPREERLKNYVII